MRETIRDLWFYALGFSIFMLAAPVVAFMYPHKDSYFGAMNAAACLCIFVAFVFFIMACAHAGKSEHA
jgi:hypothetical protein